MSWQDSYESDVSSEDDLNPRTLLGEIARVKNRVSGSSQEDLYTPPTSRSGTPSSPRVKPVQFLHRDRISHMRPRPRSRSRSRSHSRSPIGSCIHSNRRSFVTPPRPSGRLPPAGYVNPPSPIIPPTRRSPIIPPNSGTIPPVSLEDEPVIDFFNDDNDDFGYDYCSPDEDYYNNSNYNKLILNGLKNDSCQSNQLFQAISKEITGSVDYFENYRKIYLDNLHLYKDIESPSENKGASTSDIIIKLLACVLNVEFVIHDLKNRRDTVIKPNSSETEVVDSIHLRLDKNDQFHAFEDQAQIMI